MLINQLPAQSTRFIGRQHEVADIIRLLGTPECRLLTLIGQGGIGKTRLSLEVAHQLFEQQNDSFPDGIAFVPLASLSSADNIALAISNALNVHLNDTGTLDVQLVNYLRDRQILLVLDNFEHVMAGASLISRLLDEAAQNKILITSRERLHLEQEDVYSLHGMTTPETDQVESIEDFDALLLFQQIAEKVDWRFTITDDVKPHVIRICQLVQGMPLAIELAAAWVRALSCETIQQELERNFELLGDSLTHVPERHRSLRIVFEYSWNLLAGTERDIFQSLSVFRGGFTREAAEQIAGATVNSLLSLVDKSLIQYDTNERYTIHEQLRQFAEEKLNRNPADAQKLRDQHSKYYARFLEQFATDFVVYDYDLPAIDIIKSDLDNVYFMWDWAIDHHQTDAINRASDSLYHYYRMGDMWGEGVAIFQKALAMVEAQHSSPAQQKLLAKLLSMLSLFTYFSALRELTDTMAQTGLELARKFDMVIAEARCLTVLGINAFEKGNYTEARQYLEDSRDIYAGFEDTYESQFVQLRLGYVYHRFGAFDLARQQYQYVITTGQQRQVDGQRAWALAYLGGLETYLGNYEDGRQYCTLALEIFERFGLLIGLFATSSILAEAYSGLRQFDKARFYFHKAFITHLKHGAQTNSLVMINLVRVAYMLASEGDVTRALELISFVLNNSAAWDGAKLRARSLLDELEAELSPIVIESANERGKSLELKSIVQSLIEEFDTQSANGSAPTEAISEQELALLQQVTESLASGSLLDENLSETEQKSVNNLLATVDDILENEKAKMMATFVESASHDLRTPLTIINTSLYLLDMISDPEKQKGRLQLIKEQVSHLQNLIENLITLARLDGGYNLDMQPFDLIQLITTIRETYLTKLTTDRDLDIRFNLPDAAMTMVADSENIELALVNVIENAIFYTPDGGEITISVQSDADGIIIEVRDTGIGIEEDALPYIFDRFFRVDDARTERGRAGLGLAIARKIIDVHNGQIEVESILDKGSTFRVHLPQIRQNDI